MYKYLISKNSTIQIPSIIGGILLIIGNIIGAGILALPIAIVQLGLFWACTALIFFCLLALIGAFYFLEANLAMPAGSNLISMSRAALGKFGSSLAWACNLLVMYSLISAYIAGGGDFIHINLERLGILSSKSLGCIIFLIFFGSVFALGITKIDYLNRLLMFSKGCVFFIVIFGLLPHLDLNYALLNFKLSDEISPSLIIIGLTSFGFAPIIPSLRDYYKSDAKKIKTIIIWGVSAALICYLIWVMVIFCVVPLEGKYGLYALMKSAEPISDLQIALNQLPKMHWATQALNVFCAICIVTSFLTNSICLADFIGDGLYLYKRANKSVVIYLLAFMPPLVAVLFYPQAFLMGLSMAGTVAIILILILPSLMVLRFRYLDGQRKFTSYINLFIFLMISLTLFVWVVGALFKII